METYNTGNLVILKDEFRKLQDQVGVGNIDLKKRPHLLAMKDNLHPDLYWVIPITTKNHLSPSRIEKIEEMINQSKKYIQHNFFEAATIDKVEVYLKISSAFPITEKYISHLFKRGNRQIILKNEYKIQKIEKKLRKILAFENQKPNHFEQKITKLKTLLLEEI